MTDVTGPVTGPAPTPETTLHASGPCTPWATADDICHDTGDIDDAVLARALDAASEILFELSARRFPGPCTYIVRPCSRPAVAAWWPQSPWSYASPMVVPSGGQLVSYGSCGCDQTEQCGCHSFPSVDLGYTPIITVDRVVVDGVELDPSAYRVDEWRHLVRIDGEGWDCCQNLLLADTEEGTWSVEVTYGASPPASGIIAAADLAWEFASACTGGDCALPDNVQSLVRQGVSMTFDTAQLAGLITGDEIRSVRRFLKAYNPDGLRRRATVWSPRGRQRARRTGT